MVDMGMAYLALCHTRVTGEGEEMLPEVELEMRPHDLSRWD